jgi:hypothetical protein
VLGAVSQHVPRHVPCPFSSYLTGARTFGTERPEHKK